jgi:hypothetical protein
MKLIFITLAAYLICGITNAQVGSWEIQIKRTDGVNETGTGYITVNGNGTVSGYSLTTLTFGVATYSGTWSIGGKGTILVMFTESLDGQTAPGTIVGKFNTKSLKGKTTFDDGRKYAFNGKPQTVMLDVSGNWVGTVKESGSTVMESFTATSNPDFSGVFDFSGLIGGSLAATGQVIVASSGAVSGYSVTETDGGVEANISGKANPAKETLTTKGVDQSGDKLTGKFFKQ